MAKASLTGTESFAARLRRSERWRVRLMAVALLFTLFTVLVRRAFEGSVMTDNSVFIPTVSVLLLGLSYQSVVLLVLRRRAQLGAAIPSWHWIFSVTIDLAVPCALLLILQLQSPRGAYDALSAPALLLIPIVILLSILRLRPWFSLWIGVCAALAQFALTIRATRIAAIERDQLPVLFSYGVLIALTGAAAAVVSWMARRYVIEAVEEATAVEKAQHAVALIERDLRVARDIQVGLLPLARPKLAGFDVVGMARPADLAGGGYYDWQPLPDGRLAVVIADVSGHGIGPALVTAVCRAYARANALASPDPAELMRRLNELIFDDVKGARFITLALAIVSADGNIQLVSAGQGPTLLFRAASGEVEGFGGNGLPLGVLSDQHFGTHRMLRMDSGDVLLMLTDGFFERASAGDSEQLGVQRLQAALRDNSAKPAADIIAAIDEVFCKFACGAAQSKDMTVIVIKRI